MGTRIVGILLILGGLLCGALAFLEAGGQHGWSSMMHRGRLWQGTALLELIAMAILLLLGLVTIARSRTPATR